MSKELIRRSEHRTITGMGKSSMGEKKSSRIVLGKEVNASRCAAQLGLYIPSKQDNWLRITAGSRYIIRLFGRSLCCRWRVRYLVQQSLALFSTVLIPCTECSDLSSMV